MHLKRVSQSPKDLIPSDEIQTLKLRLVTNVSCHREMEQRLINASDNTLRYINAHHSLAMKLQKNRLGVIPW